MRWTARADGFCDFVNGGWSAFTGQSLSDAEGKGWLEVIHPDDAAYLAPFLAQAYRLGQGFDLRYRVRAADGGYFWVADHAVARAGAAKPFAGYRGHLRVMGRDGATPLRAYGALSRPPHIVTLADHLLQARGAAVDIDDKTMVQAIDRAIGMVRPKLQ